MFDRSAFSKARQSHLPMVGKSTGPRTDKGKLLSCMRCLKHGLKGAGGEAFQLWLSSINRLVKKLEAN
jgi:hypothetical protein